MNDGVVVIADKIKYYDYYHNRRYDSLDDFLTYYSRCDIVISKPEYKKIKKYIRSDYQNITNKIIPINVRELTKSLLHSANIRRVLKKTDDVTYIHGFPWDAINTSEKCSITYRDDDTIILSIDPSGDDEIYYRIRDLDRNDLTNFLNWYRDPTQIFTFDGLLKKISEASDDVVTETEISAIIDLVQSSEDNNVKVGYELLARVDKIKYRNLVKLILLMFPPVNLTGREITTMRNYFKGDKRTDKWKVIKSFSEPEQNCGIQIAQMALDDAIKNFYSMFDVTKNLNLTISKK